MTGAPISGVMAFMGITSPLPGREHTTLHKSAMKAPHSNVAGSRMRWSDDLKSRRVICGTARLMKATGPQKAVVTAVSSPVVTSSSLRVRRVLLIRLLAY